MHLQNTQNIGEIVANDYRTAPVFKKYNIDFCCNGNRSLETVCKEVNLDFNSVWSELQTCTKSDANNATDFQTWSIALLAEYVEKKHHKYVEKKIVEIKPYLTKICSVHGNHHPELLEINALFNDCAEELTTHMKKEELLLFPYIKKLVRLKEDNINATPPPFGTVQNPIAMMHQEHDNEGERFRKIAALSNNYTLPADGCNTYSVALGLLKEFEDDLHLHIHLENNIMFPKAIALEKELLTKN